MKKSFSVFVFLAIVTVASVCLAEEKVVIAVDEANAPFMYGTATQANGVYPRLLVKIFEKMGTPLELRAYPWKRALVLGEKGDSGVGGIYKNEARLKIFDYSDSIFEERLNFYVRKGNNFVLQDIADLKGKSIGVIRGWSYGDAFDKGRADGIFKIEENVSDELNFKKLNAKRLDCVIAIEQSADTVISRLGLENQIEVSGNSFAVNPTYIVFAKTKKNQAVLEKFNTMLKAMKDDGSYDALVKESFQLEASK